MCGRQQECCRAPNAVAAALGTSCPAVPSRRPCGRLCCQLNHHDGSSAAAPSFLPAQRPRWWEGRAFRRASSATGHFEEGVHQGSHHAGGQAAAKQLGGQRGQQAVLVVLALEGLPCVIREGVWVCLLVMVCVVVVVGGARGRLLAAA